MKLDRRAFFQFFFFTVIGIALIFLLVRSLSAKDKHDIVTSLTNANYFALILPFILNTLSNLVRALRWKQLYSNSERAPSSTNAFFALMIGYLANYGLPRMGEITRCAVLKKYEDIPVETSLGTVVIERIVDMISLIILLVFVTVWQYKLLFSFLKDLKTSLFHSLGQANFMQYLFIGIVAFIITVVLYLVVRRKATLFDKIKKVLNGFLKGLLSIRHIQSPGRFLFYTILMWVLYAFTIYFSFNSLSTTKMLGVGAAFSVLAFSTFGNILVQAGFAAYPFIVMQVLKQYGVEASQGFAMGWIMFCAQLFVVLLIGVLSLLLLPVLNRNRNEQARIHPVQNS